MTVTALEKQLFGYDAVESTPRRKAPSSDMRSEDQILNSLQRDTLSTSSLDAKRNFAIAAWMIRKHLDFVADFSFQANTSDKEWNKRAEKFIKQWSKRKNCHVSKRHPLRRLIRIAEVCRTTAGDDLVELMRNGSLNIVRGDRIRNPRGASNSAEWKHGIRINTTTEEPVAYQIHARTLGGSFRPQKQIPSRNAIHHGYFDDPEQVRGVSPLSTAINNLRDTYEGIDFALVRLKAEMILGIVVEKDPDTDTMPFQGNQQFDNSEDDEDLSDEEKEAAFEARAEEEDKRGLVDYGRGIFQWEMRKGEKVKTVGGTMPSSNAQAFLQVCIHIALKALDLPYSFYSEDFTNFYGSRGALQLYKRSAQHKQADNQELLDEITVWRLRQAIIDGDLDLPRGWKLDEIEWMWVPRGIPWWDRSKEVIGDIRAIAAGLDTPQNVCLEHGTGSFEDNLDKLAEAKRLWEEKLGPDIPAGFMSLANVAAGSGESSSQKKSKSKDDDE